MKMKDESEKAGLKVNIQKSKIIASGFITSWQIEGDKMKTVTGFILLGFKVTMGSVCSHKLKRCLLLGRKAMTNLDSILKSKTITLMKNVHSQSYGFSSSQEQMWELGHKEGWVLKNWWFQTVVLGKTLDSPLGCKEIKPINPKGNWPWIFTGRTDAEAEAPILWPPDAKSWLTGKDPLWGRLRAKGEEGGRGWDG